MPLFKKMLMLWVLSLSACAHITPVNQLVLPPCSVIEGQISQITDDGFMLKDASGIIQVHTLPSQGLTHKLKPGERVRVYGNLSGSLKKTFDAYVIRKPNDERIMVNKPAPHIGLVIQTAFD